MPNNVAPEIVYLSKDNNGDEFRIKYFTIKKLIEKGLLKCGTIKEFMNLVEVD